MDLVVTWFLLFGVLIIGYAILDGFDLGVGVLHLFAKSDHERRIGINAIAPVWDGNEVWLLTGGGALFAAFPRAYATLFSSFYLALVLVLGGLIFRAVAMEFRSKVDSPTWRRVWDWAFGLGSLLPALLFGVAVGNILRGIPLDAQQHFTGTFLGLLNVFSLLCGLVGLAMFTMHGAIYLCIKGDGELRERMEGWVTKSWIVFVVLLVAALGLSFISAKHLFAHALHRPLFWVALFMVLGGMVYIPVAAHGKRYMHAFLASSSSIAGILLLGGTGLFPMIVPSSTDLANSLTIYQAASTHRTLKVMLVIALIGMPLVVAYTTIIYRVFKGKTVLNKDSY